LIRKATCLGSIIAITDSSSDPIQISTYDEYG